MNDVTKEDIELRKKLLANKMTDKYRRDFSFLLNLLENDLDPAKEQIYLLICDTIIFYQGVPRLWVKMGNGLYNGQPRFIRDDRKLEQIEIRNFLAENKFKTKYLPTYEELKIITNTLGTEDINFSYISTKEKFLNLKKSKKAHRKEARKHFRVYLRYVDSKFLVSLKSLENNFEMKNYPGFSKMMQLSKVNKFWKTLTSIQRGSYDKEYHINIKKYRFEYGR